MPSAWSLAAASRTSRSDDSDFGSNAERVRKLIDDLNNAADNDSLKAPVKKPVLPPKAPPKVVKK